MCLVGFEPVFPQKIRYAIAVGDSLALIDDPHRRGEPPFSVDTEVALGLVSEQVVLLAD